MHKSAFYVFLSLSLIFLHHLSWSQEQPGNLLRTLKAMHTRWLANAADFEKLKTGIAQDQALQSWYKHLVQQADQMLTEPVNQTLGLKYQLSKDARQVRRGIAMPAHNRVIA